MRFFIVSGLCFVCLVVSPALEARAAQQQEAPSNSVPRIAVKGELMKKMVVQKVNPRYPPEAIQQRIAGTVKLRVIIGVDGGGAKGRLYLWTVCIYATNSRCRTQMEIQTTDG